VINNAGWEKVEAYNYTQTPLEIPPEGVWFIAYEG
jgi:hypothetical protein